MANAQHNDSIDPNELYVSACFADEGPTLKRWRPRARGRATRIRKRTCHVTLIVSRMDPKLLEQRRATHRGRRQPWRSPPRRRRRPPRARRPQPGRRRDAHDHDHDHERTTTTTIHDEVDDADHRPDEEPTEADEDGRRGERRPDRRGRSRPPRPRAAGEPEEAVEAAVEEAAEDAATEDAGDDADEEKS